MDTITFTNEEKKCLDSIRQKKLELQKKEYNYYAKYGKLEGSVFDGGFYRVVHTEKMTEKERQEYETIKNELEYIREYLK